MAYLAVLTGVLAIAGAAVLIRLSGAPAAVLIFYRLVLAQLLLVPLAYWRARADWSRLRARDLAQAGAAGVFLALHFLAWVGAVRLTSVASASVLVSMHPVFVLAGGCLGWGRRAGAGELRAVAVALAGAVVIGAGRPVAGGAYSLAGDALALLGAAMMAAYLLIGAGFRRRWPLLVYAPLAYGVAAGVALLVCLVGDYPLRPYPPGEWGVFVALAALPTLLGHTMFNWALGQVPAAVVSVAVLCEPVGAAVLARIVLGETPGPATLVGGAMVLAGTARFLWLGTRTDPGGRSRNSAPASE